MAFFRRLVPSRKTLAYTTSGTLVIGVGGYYYLLNSGPSYPPSTLQTRRPPPPWTPPSRFEMLTSLQKDEFDLLVVGGGATGAGVALDAVSRGLKVALVERDDFSSGTSSKSTKLVHGGVRYLQKAVFELDYEQYKLVKEALHERRIFLQTAPYLSAMLPIMLPIYKYWQIPYYWSGCKMYDILAGEENMESSYLMSKGKALAAFPLLKSEGLVGALVYYDGQHNDSRMNMALIMTAVKLGATVLNKADVIKLEKSASGKLNGAKVRDVMTGKEMNIRAKGVVNATGPFCDELLQLDDPSHIPIVQASSGIHITLPSYYSPRKMGMLDPATSDGRVIFFLPWQGSTIAGTTDASAPVEREPKAHEEEIRWVLEEVRRYLAPDIKVRRGDVLSAWSGLRPLVRNPKAEKTEGLVRNHMIHVSDSGLLTIAGGKWTTYRAMASETVDKAVETFNLEKKVTNGCVTEKLRLIGSDGWSLRVFIGTIQYGLDADVAKHLADNYGDLAWTVASLAAPTGQSWPLHGIRLSPNHSFIEAEVLFALRNEYALTPIDILARRTRLSFLNTRAALDALPRVVEIMGNEFEWSSARRKAEYLDAIRFLKTSMGLQTDAEESSGAASSIWNSLKTAAGFTIVPKMSQFGRANFERGEVDHLRSAFDQRIDSLELKEGVKAVQLSTRDVQQLLKDLPGYADFKLNEFAYVLDEAGLGQRKTLNFDEFIEVCAALKEVSLPPVKVKALKKGVPVEHSGGGV